VKARRRSIGGRLAQAVLILGSVCLAAQERPATPRLSRDVRVTDAEIWTVTDIELQPGERAVFRAGGTARCPGLSTEVGPDGEPRGFRDLIRSLPVNQAGLSALIGRVGDESSAQPFLIGASREVVSPSRGLLALGINRSASDICGTTYTVHVDVFAPAEGSHVVVAKTVDAIDGVDRPLFDRIPRRVADKQGNPGDMINFLIVGSAAGTERVFKAAGWVTVDADVAGAVIQGVLDSLSHVSYLTMPMSQLYLFGRPQDVGWAHAEPLMVVASRHHLRLWQAPFQAAGLPLWIGAATHDIGFERDRRNNGVTHKIDPDVDLERAFVEKTLTSTGMVAETSYVLPDKAVRDAKTATGGSFHSDGRVLVLKLEESR